MQAIDNELFFAGILIESGETIDATYTEKIKKDETSTFKKVIEWLKAKAKQILESVKRLISGIANKIKNIGMVVKSLKLDAEDAKHVRLSTSDDRYNKEVMRVYERNVVAFGRIQSRIKDELMELKSAHSEAAFRGCEEKVAEIEKEVAEIREKYEEDKKTHIHVQQYAMSVQKIYQQISKPIGENARQLGRYMTEYVKSMIRSLSTNSKDPEEVEKSKEELRMARMSVGIQFRILRLLIRSAISTSINKFFKFPTRKVEL